MHTYVDNLSSWSFIVNGHCFPIVFVSPLLVHKLVGFPSIVFLFLILVRKSMGFPPIVFLFLILVHKSMGFPPIVFLFLLLVHKYVGFPPYSETSDFAVDFGIIAGANVASKSCHEYPTS